MAGNLTEEKKTVMLLEEWKLAAEMAYRVSARRIEASKLYTSLLTGLLAVLPLAMGNNASHDVQKLSFIGIGLMGICLCGIWMLNLRSYSQLNSLKFKTIHELEQKLPFAYYAREWQILKEQPKQTYTRLSKVERFIPLLIMIPYIVIFAYALIIY